MSKILRYMSMAHHQAMLSKALNSRVGAILVKNDTVISQGFNGIPRGIPEKDNWERFPRLVYNQLVQKANELNDSEWQLINKNIAHPDIDYDPRYLLGYKSGYGIKWQLDSHAERNAIFNAARIGVSTIDSIMYCWCGIPCKECAIAIVQAGISEVYCLDIDSIDSSNSKEEEVSDYNFYMARYILTTAGVSIKTISKEEVEAYELSLKHSTKMLAGS